MIAASFRKLLHRHLWDSHATRPLGGYLLWNPANSSMISRARACASVCREPVGVDSRVRAELGEVDVLVYNAGSGSWGSIEEITPEAFEAAWRVNALGSLLVARQVIPAMKRAGAGSIIFIGATASLRGMPRTAAFAPAKAAQRILAESMARSLWPAGIHVALVVLDGVVDLPKTREMMPDKSEDFFIKPKDVAESAFWLSGQARSAWSFAIEARPFGETW
jgi:NAD(P)-dependent dehydrogenase (short-subunit alcohol dehydrogenase family)